MYEYVNKLLKSDLKLINLSAKTNELLSIIDLERKMSTSVTIDIKGIPTLVYIKGSADRIDKLGNYIRVIDYKSSIKTTDKFKFIDFELLFSDKDYNKMLQLFMYAWLAVKNNIAKAEQLQPCIIAFKKFEEKPRFIIEDIKGNPILNFTNELLADFEAHLIIEIQKMIDGNTSFIQTEDLKTCEYCAYAAICNV